MQTQQAATSQRQMAAQKYNTARANLLTMLILTLLNIVMLFVGADFMLLFSATVPYFAAALGFYSALDIFLYPCLIFAGICLLAYFICWILSKNHYGWMIAALVLFGIDTLALVCLSFWTEDFSNIMDIVFHAWILYYLILGVKNGHDLKTLPEDAEAVAAAQSYAQPITNDSYSQPVTNSTHLRWADREVKHRVFLEAEAEGCRICYRRVKRVNELVVNGYVYAEMELLMEPAHELSATVNGHLIQAGYNGSMSYIRVDGKQVAQKVRWY